MSEVIILENEKQISQKIAEDILNIYNQTSEVFNIAISGGNTPKSLFILLAEKYNKKFDWNRVNIFWVDERLVTLDSDESNYGAAKKLLIDNINIPERNIHRIKGESNPDQELIRYTNDIKESVEFKNNYPAFDYILLGIGDDGHTASIFPENTEDINSKEICLLAKKPESGQLRISLSIPTINNAKNSAFMITGKNKAVILKEIIEEKSKAYPSGLIENKNLRFFLDKQAASLLTKK